MSNYIKGLDEVMEHEKNLVLNGPDYDTQDKAANNYIRLAELKHKMNVEENNRSSEGQKLSDTRKKELFTTMSNIGVKVVEVGVVVLFGLLSLRFERGGSFTSTVGRSTMQSLARKPLEGFLK